jgi:hypothetical protein
MKYQLSVWWRDGSSSGRLVEIPWPLAKDPRYAKRIKLESLENDGVTLKSRKKKGKK